MLKHKQVLSHVNIRELSSVRMTMRETQFTMNLQNKRLNFYKKIYLK